MSSCVSNTWLFIRRWVTLRCFFPPQTSEMNTLVRNSFHFCFFAILLINFTFLCCDILLCTVFYRRQWDEAQQLRWAHPNHSCRRGEHIFLLLRNQFSFLCEKQSIHIASGHRHSVIFVIRGERSLNFNIYGPIALIDCQVKIVSILLMQWENTKRRLSHVYQCHAMNSSRELNTRPEDIIRSMWRIRDTARNFHLNHKKWSKIIWIYLFGQQNLKMKRQHEWNNLNYYEF